MIRVHTLGTATIEAGRNRLTPASVRKFALLLHLAAEPGRRISRATLRELIFPDKTEKSAGHSLRELVYQFRHSGIPLTAELDGVELDPSAVSSDYAEIVRGGSPSAEQLRAAAGGFLPGYAPRHSEAFSEWLDGYRAQTTFEVCRALLKEVARSRSLGDWQTMERAARACLALDALNEEATLALAEVLAIGGSKAQAVRLLDTYMHELGDSSRDLRVSAAVLRRRIGEKMPSTYPTRLASPFVGRGPQMLELRTQLAFAAAGKSNCVAILGEAGIGKSRLVSEFCAVAALEGASIAMTGAQPSDVHRPFSAFADIAPSMLKMPGALGCAPSSLRAIGRLTKSHSEDPPLAEDAIRNSEALCDSIAHALFDLVDAISAEQPLVMGIEDIHWLDGMSRRVVAGLLSRRRSRRLLLLATSRETQVVQEIFRHADAVSTIDLGGLDSESINRMAADFAEQSDVQLDVEMHAWLEKTSVGNPLFLESLLSHFAETSERFAVSPNLARLIESRMRALQSDALTTLQLCALLGKYSTLESIIDATDLSRFELIRAIASLEATRLIKSDANHVKPAHGLVAEVALSLLTPLQARVAHRCVAESLERLLPLDKSPGLIWDCAEHWIAARSTRRAVDFLQTCAIRALDIGRPGDAARILSRALSFAGDGSLKRAIAESMAIAADAADESALALVAIDAMEPAGPAMHNELEFIPLRARLRLRLMNTETAERLLLCIQSEDAAPDHRVAAATLVLKFADGNGDLMLAERATSLLPQQIIDSATDILRLEFLILRATIFRDWDMAGSAGSRLLTVAATAPMHVRLILQGNAMLALDRAGITDKSTEAAKLIFRDSYSAGLTRLSVRAAGYLCETFLDLGDDTAADEWFAALQRLGDDFPELSDDFRFVITELHRACSRNDGGSARRTFDRAQRRGVFSDAPLSVRFYRVMAAWVDQTCGSLALSEGDLAYFKKAALDDSSSNNVRDIEAAVACRALLGADRRDEAARLYTEYVAVFRHGPSPQSKCLQQVRAMLFS